MWRFAKFLKSTGKLGGSSVTLSLVCFSITVREHFVDHNVAASIFGLMTICLFCFGAYWAWDEESRAKEALEKKYFDGRPILGLKIDYYGEMADFRIEHLAGRPAMNITADSIVSLDGTMKLHFETASYINGTTYECLKFDVEQINLKAIYPTPQKIWETLKARGILELFTKAVPKGEKASYMMTLRFLDNSDERSQLFQIAFDPFKGATALTLPD